MKIPRYLRFAPSAALALTVVTSGCHYPSNLKSHSDIWLTSKGETHINVSRLPLDLFPKLAKFHQVFEVDFDGGGTDDKLKALAQIGFTNLSEVVLTDCPLVTDKGIDYLSAVSSIRGLGLRGTSITDRSVATFARMSRLEGVNIEGSTGVTLKGLMTLAQSDTLTDICFSGAALTQGDLLRIIGAVRHVTRIEIVDPADGRLDAPALREAARAKNIKLYAVRNKGCSAL
jgi:hypothetical protein